MKAVATNLARLNIQGYPTHESYRRDADRPSGVGFGREKVQYTIIMEKGQYTTIPAWKASHPLRSPGCACTKLTSMNSKGQEAMKGKNISLASHMETSAFMVDIMGYRKKEARLKSRKDHRESLPKQCFTQ